MIQLSGLQPAGHMRLSKSIHADLFSTDIILSTAFDVDFKELSLQLQIELIYIGLPSRLGL